jgi:hypothetical protein
MTYREYYCLMAGVMLASLGWALDAGMLDVAAGAAATAAACVCAYRTVAR